MAPLGFSFGHSFCESLTFPVPLVIFSCILFTPPPPALYVSISHFTKRSASSKRTLDKIIHIQPFKRKNFWEVASVLNLNTSISKQLPITAMRFLAFVLIGLLVATALLDLTSAQRRQGVRPLPVRAAAAKPSIHPQVHPEPKHHSNKHHDYHRHLFRKRDLVDFPEYEDSHI